jgi:hypothetical protein
VNECEQCKSFCLELENVTKERDEARKELEMLRAAQAEADEMREALRAAEQRELVALAALDDALDSLSLTPYGKKRHAST